MFQATRSKLYRQSCSLSLSLSLSRARALSLSLSLSLCIYIYIYIYIYICIITYICNAYSACIRHSLFRYNILNVVGLLGTEVGQRKEVVRVPQHLRDGVEDGKTIIHRLGCTLLNEHEKLFGSYWRPIFGQLPALAGKRHVGSCLPASPRAKTIWVA
jgi:hypothetical protein